MRSSLSVYLDALRFLAAAVVFFAHASYERLTDGALPDLVFLGSEAVMAFFVLSGFVIAYTADRNEVDLGRFCRARLARLWSVVIPALVVTVIADQIGRRVDPALYDGWWYTDSWPVVRFLASALFLNEIWFESIRAFSNGPFWSISYEFWYYVIFAAAFFLRGWWRILAVAAAALVAGPRILILFPVWCLGAALWFARDRIPERAGWALFIGSFVAYAAWQAIDGRALTARSIDIHLPFGLGWSTAVLAKWIVGVIVACNIAGFIAVGRRVNFGPSAPLDPLARRHDLLTLSLPLSAVASVCGGASRYAGERNVCHRLDARFRRRSGARYRA